MIYLIQEGFYKDENIKKLLHALEETNSTYKLVVVTEDSINCYLREDEKYFIFGGNKFSELAKEVGLFPGTYKNENFNHAICVDHWGTEMLNADYLIGDIFEIEPQWNRFFIRPLLDDKLIVGKVTTQEELAYNRAKAIDYYKGKQLIASEVKDIQKEYRLFIVDNKVVTGSLYVVNKLLFTSAEIPCEVIKYAEKLMGTWTPSLAYVLDIAETKDGFKVLEINNINAAGFYCADVTKILKALNKLNA